MERGGSGAYRLGHMNPTPILAVHGAETGEVISATATVALLALLVALVVERIRHHFPNLPGDLIIAVAWVLGFALAWWWDLRVAADYGFPDVPPILDWITTGLIVAGGAGFIGTVKNAYRAADPASSMYRGSFLR
jgi:hypothetical protein